MLLNPYILSILLYISLNSVFFPSPYTTLKTVYTTADCTPLNLGATMSGLPPIIPVGSSDHFKFYRDFIS